MFTVGEKYKDRFLITQEIVSNFADFSSDYNPIHVDAAYAKQHGYSRQVSHGVIQLVFLSKIIGMDFPGAGAMWMKQTVNWLLPVLVGDSIEIILTVKHYSYSTKILILLVEIFNQQNKRVMTGESQVKITKQLSNKIVNQLTDVNFVENQKVNAIVDSDKNYNISNKRVALVTGATRGIGEAIVRRLAYDGFNVVVNYRNDKESANIIVDEIIRLGGDAIAVYSDITSKNDIKSMSDVILNKWGRCDVIIHGASPPLEIINVEQLSYENIELYLDVYLKGAVTLVEFFSPLMVSHKFGRFVFLGTSALYGEPPAGMAAYVAAKEALWGYTKSLATSMARYGITANMVSPSLTITELTTDVPARVKEVEAIKSPMRRLATVDDTANQISYLCNDNSSYVNGINIPITGGPI